MVAVGVLGLSLGPAAAQDQAAHRDFLFAYKLLQKDKHEAAAEKFDQYLSDYSDAPKRGDARYFRAMLHRRAGELKQAAALLENAPPPQIVAAHGIKLLRGQVLIDLKRYEPAIETLEAIDTEALDKKVRAAVFHARGLAYRGSGNLTAAAKSLDEAVQAHEVKKSKGQALLDLARVLVAQDEVDGAIARLKQATTIQPVGAEAARLAGDLSYERDQYNQAAEFYQHVLANHQSAEAHFGPALVGLLWSRYSDDAHQAVVDTFQQYEKLLPKAQSGEAHYLVGSSLRALNKPAKAKEHLQKAANTLSGPKRAKALYKLADVQLSLEAYDAVTQTVGRLQRAFPDHALAVEGTFLLAKADARQDNVSRAVDRLSAVIDRGRDQPYYEQAVLRRARLYDQAGEVEAAIADYERYLDAASRDSSQLRQAMLKLVDLYYRAGQHKQAVQTASQLLAKSDLSQSLVQELLYREALARIKLNELEKALASLTKLQQQHPVNPFKAEARYYRALLLTSLDRGAEAAPLLKQIAAGDELTRDQRANALRLLAAHQRETDKPASAAKTLSDLRSLVGASQMKSSDLLWLGRRAMDRGEVKAALQSLEPLLKRVGQLQPGERAAVTYLAARAYRQTGQPGSAVELLGRVIERADGYGLEARLELARARAAQGKRQAAIDVLEKLIRDTQQARIVAEAHYEAAGLYQALGEGHDANGRAAEAKKARKQGREHLMRIVLLYDQFDSLQGLVRDARLKLADLARQDGDTATRIEQLKALAKTNGPYGRYAKAMLAAAEKQRYGEALARLKALQRDANVTLESPLAETVAASIARLEEGS